MPLTIRVRRPLALCGRCAFGTIMTNRARGTLTFCAAVKAFVPLDIETCTDYECVGRRPLSHWDGDVPIIDVRPLPGRSI